MRTNKERVYAAGDITEFPLFIKDDSIVNVQHYQMAHAQGKYLFLPVPCANKFHREIIFILSSVY